jgi:hypothetical protein
MTREPRRLSTVSSYKEQSQFAKSSADILLPFERFPDASNSALSLCYGPGVSHSFPVILIA